VGIPLVVEPIPFCSCIVSVTCCNVVLLNVLAVANSRFCNIVEIAKALSSVD
jgi:hypothetical protein